MSELSEYRRNVSLFLASLRHSIDRPFRARQPIADVERERFTRAILMIEEARIRFSISARFRDEMTEEEWALSRRDLASFVKKFASNDDFGRQYISRRFVLTPMSPDDRNSPTYFMKTIMSDDERKLTIIESLDLFMDYLGEVGDGVAKRQHSLSFTDLEHIVPRQQVAPVQFEIENGRIVVVNRSPKAEKIDKNNIHAALEHIKESGAQLIKSLADSNCDRRLLDGVMRLQSQLESDGNIVKIGLMNMACGVMSAQFQAELPNAVVAMFNSYSSSISLYVAQFPEWGQFTKKAAAIELDENDISEVDAAAEELISVLNQHPELADPEVPKTIEFVRQFLSAPGTSSKRAAFAMIRTIENLVSSILRHSVVFFNKTAEKVTEVGSSAASRMIVGLLGIALVSASGIGQAAVRAGAPWVKQAADVVQKQIERLSE